MSNIKDTFNKGIDAGYNAISRVTSITSSNSEKIGKTIVNAILLIIIFAIFGCFDFLTMSFHFELLASVRFWTKVISKSIAGICAYNIGINLSWDRELEKDTLLSENALKYERLNKLRDTKSFNTYIIDIFNPNEKKKAYIAKINQKLYWLDKIGRNKSKLLYSLVGESEQTVPITSAVHVNGRKLYQYAHLNQEVELPKRTIDVKESKRTSIVEKEKNLKNSKAKNILSRTLIALE